MRRGWTLFEVLVSIGVGTAVMSCCVVVLGLVLHTDRLSQQQAYATAVVGRLNTAFRRDVHESSIITQAKKDSKWLELNVADRGRVVYGATADGVVRQELKGDRITREDLFRLPEGLAIDFNVDEQSKPNIARLRLSSEERAGLNLVIEAASAGDMERSAK